ncbi:hypothetical protein JQC92_21690 [Shewanella sp. 202IG2-18]|uniref:hypothetical protein n=1 Tax=Parashewanella hymeniacidonis TaxID=2807618 RepID=UPI001961A24D|nr:hypothetical protein [Parashewanella hymeniacidonis]MBM7074595.1 hypothetical protein [Parashewanella hymeniacidonis]
MNVQANDVKVKGVKALSDAIDSDGVCIVSSRGKPILAAIDIEQYQKFREWELSQALAECETDIAAGDYKVIDDVDAHVAELLSENESRE